MSIKMTSTNSPVLLISAGEASGDAHAAAVIKALKKQQPDISIRGIAGPLMRDAGCQSIANMESLNVMGFTDVIKSLPRIQRIGKKIIQDAQYNKPDVALLVDYPGFNLRLGQKLRKQGIPVMQYIAPKLWAWGAWRVPRLRKSQDIVASILPFEKQWFGERDVDLLYVGNPSAYKCATGWDRQTMCEQWGLDATHPILALLPGSRPSELRHHVALLAECWQRISTQIPQCQCVVPRASGINETLLQPLMAAGVVLVERNVQHYALRTDAAIAVSGTATLELALWNTPTLLVYRTSPLTFAIGIRLLQTHCVGLANILLDDTPVMPELLQDNCNIDNIVQHTLNLLCNKTQANAQKAKFANLRTLLGNNNPATKVAKVLLEMSKS
ncbi:MAG: lipid-A-disaccharide synthase [Mariprofundales bacterium]